MNSESSSGRPVRSVALKSKLIRENDVGLTIPSSAPSLPAVLSPQEAYRLKRAELPEGVTDSESTTKPHMNLESEDDERARLMARLAELDLAKLQRAAVGKFATQTGSPLGNGSVSVTQPEATQTGHRAEETLLSELRNELDVRETIANLHGKSVSPATRALRVGTAAIGSPPGQRLESEREMQGHGRTSPRLVRSDAKGSNIVNPRGLSSLLQSNLPEEAGNQRRASRLKEELEFESHFGSLGTRSPARHGSPAGEAQVYGVQSALPPPASCASSSESREGLIQRLSWELEAVNKAVTLGVTGMGDQQRRLQLQLRVALEGNFPEKLSEPQPFCHQSPIVDGARDGKMGPSGDKAVIGPSGGTAIVATRPRELLGSTLGPYGAPPNSMSGCSGSFTDFALAPPMVPSLVSQACVKPRPLVSDPGRAQLGPSTAANAPSADEATFTNEQAAAIGPSPHEQQAEALRLIAQSLSMGKEPGSEHDKTVSQNPSAEHPNHTYRRFVLSECDTSEGRRLGVGVGNGFVANVANALRNPGDYYDAYRFHFLITARILVHTARCELRKLCPEEFAGTQKRDNLLSQNLLEQPLKLGSAPAASCDVAHLRRCFRNMFCWLGAVFGDTLASRLVQCEDDAHGLHESNSEAVTASDYKLFVLECVREVETQASDGVDSVLARATASSQPIRGTSEIAMTQFKFIALTVCTGGSTFLLPASRRLDPSHPEYRIRASLIRHYELLRLSVEASARKVLSAAVREGNPESSSHSARTGESRGKGRGAGGIARIKPATVSIDRSVDGHGSDDAASTGSGGGSTPTTPSGNGVSNEAEGGGKAKEARKPSSRVELTRIERAASLRGLPEVNGERPCYGFQTVNGCKVDECSFPHVALPASDIASLSPEAQLLAAVRGGFKLGKHVPQGCAEAEVAALRSRIGSVPARGMPRVGDAFSIAVAPAQRAPSSLNADAVPFSAPVSADTNAPFPSEFSIVKDSTHPLEQPLRRVLEHPRSRLLSAELEAPRVRFPQTMPDSDHMGRVRQAKEVLLQYQPSLTDMSPALQALVYNVAANAIADGANTTGADLLGYGVKALELSNLAGSSQAADLLRPPRTSAGSELTALRARMRDGSPFLVMYPLGPEQLVRVRSGQLLPGRVGVVHLLGETMGRVDFGETIGDELGMCVPLHLAITAGVEPRAALAFYRSAIQASTVALGDIGAVVSPEEVQVRSLHHDLHHQGAAIDAHIARYVGLHASMRIVLVVTAEPGASLMVHVLQPLSWDRGNDKSVVCLIARNHMSILTLSARLGGGQLGRLRDRGLPEASNDAVDAFLAGFLREGVLPLTFHMMDNAAVANAPKSLSSSVLSVCPFCKRPATASRTQALAATCVGAVPVVPQVPPTVREWLHRVNAVGGFSKRNRHALAVNRSPDYQRWMAMSSAEILDHPFPAEIKERAAAVLRAAREGFAAAEKPKILARDPAALEALGAAVHLVATLGDELLGSVGSLRASLIAFRQAVLVTDGRLPLDWNSCQKYSDLLDEVHASVLRDIANFGAPLLEVCEPVPTAEKKPYASAQVVAHTLALAVLEQASHGWAILLTGASKELLHSSDLTLTPTGAAPKKLPNGDLSGTYRVISDMRAVNERVAEQSSAQYALVALEPPPAVCPKVTQVARVVLYHALNYPMVDIDGYFKDINHAFKRVSLALEDAPSFGTVLPTADIPHLLTVIILVIALTLVFGWTNSPGYWGVVGLAMNVAHNRMGCEEPELNGDNPNSGFLWVDDNFTVGPRLGMSLEIGSQKFNDIAEAFAGPGAINVEKDKANGVPQSKPSGWGYLWDFSAIRRSGPLSGTFSTLPDKVTKLKKLMTGPAFQERHTWRIQLRQLESLRGLAQWVLRPAVALRGAIAAFNDLAVSMCPDGMWVMPPGDAHDVNRLWNRFNASFDLVLVAISDLQAADSGKGFEGKLVSLLPPEEQVALGRPFSIMSSDSTGLGDEFFVTEAGEVCPRSGVCAFVDYDTGSWAAEEVEELVGLIAERVPGIDRPTQIVVGETLPYVAAAMCLGEAWRGKLKAALVDNFHSVVTMDKRTPSDPYLDFLMRILSRLETVNDFQMIGFYINTKHNLLSDDLTRLYHTHTEAQLQARVEELHQGYRRIALTPFIKFLLNEGVSSPSVVLLGEEEKALARTLSNNARERAILHEFTSTRLQPRGSCVELQAGLAQFAHAASLLGLNVEALSGKCSLTSTYGLARIQKHCPNCCLAETFERGSTVEIIFVGPSPMRNSGEVIEEIELAVSMLKPLFLIAEVLPTLGENSRNLEFIFEADEAMKRQGYHRVVPLLTPATESGFKVEIVDSAHLNGGQRRVRGVLHYEREQFSSVLPDLNEPQPVPGTARCLREIVAPLGEEPAHLWLTSGAFLPEKRRNAGGLAGLWKLGGSDKVVAGSLVTLFGHLGEWKVLTVKADGDLVVQELRAEKTRRKSVKVSDVERHILQHIPVVNLDSTGNTVLAWNDGVSGATNNLILDNRDGRQRIRKLSSLEGWRLMGFEPSEYEQYCNMNPTLGKRDVERAVGNALTTVFARAIVTRAVHRLAMLQGRLRLLKGPDGRWARTVAVGEHGEHPYEPHLVGRREDLADDGPSTKANGRNKVSFEGAKPREHDGFEMSRAAIGLAVARSVSTGTGTTYESAFKRYVLWRNIKGQVLWLTGENVADDEDVMVEFAAHVVLVAGYTYSYLHVVLYAIRYYHMLERLPDPLREKPLLKIALKGLSRISGPKVQKFPITMDIIRCAVGHLNLDEWDDLVTALAMLTMFLFLLRAREALCKGHLPDEEQCLRVHQFVFCSEGTDVEVNDVQKADEIVLLQGRSKTDQAGHGRVANVYEANDPLCLVGLFKRAATMNPSHFQRGDRYMFTLRDGSTLKYSAVLVRIRQAAVELGIPPEALSIISFRSGGATAMWNCGFSVDQIKRRGRWASECWRTYVWEGRDGARDVAGKMLGTSFSLMASAACYRRQVD